MGSAIALQLLKFYLQSKSRIWMIPSKLLPWRLEHITLTQIFGDGTPGNMCFFKKLENHPNFNECKWLTESEKERKTSLWKSTYLIQLYWQMQLSFFMFISASCAHLQGGVNGITFGSLLNTAHLTLADFKISVSELSRFIANPSTVHQEQATTFAISRKL